MRDILGIRWRHRQLGRQPNLVSEPVSRPDA
jgi:hypothetical protein